MSDTTKPTPTVRRVCSSLRTTCCGARIKNEAACPRCRREVLPLTLAARWEHVRHMEAILDRLAHLAMHGDAEDVPEADRLFAELGEGEAVEPC